MTEKTVQKNSKQMILEGAATLFSEKGFSATSMSAIAKAIGVPKSLLYHHFENKEALWMQSKAFFRDMNIPVEPNQHALETPDSLLEFVEAVVDSRFSIYQNNPGLTKMMNWQRLEKNKEPIKSTSPFSPSRWFVGIEYLQKSKQINPELNVEMVVAFLRSSIMGVFQDDYYEFSKSASQLTHYKENLILWITSALSNK